MRLKYLILKSFEGHAGIPGHVGGSLPKGIRSQEDLTDVLKDESGKIIDLYHGSSNQFDNFRTPEKFSPQEQLGFGIHFAESQGFANRYAIGKKGNIKKVSLKIKKLLKADEIVTEGTPEFELAKKIAGKKLLTQKNLQGKRQCYLQNAINSVPPKKASRIIQDFGYDGIRYEATYGSRNLRGMSIDDKSISYIVFNPEQIIIRE